MSMAKEKNQIKANLTRDRTEEHCCPSGLKHSLEKHIEHQRKSVPADGRKGAYCPQKRVLLFKRGSVCKIYVWSSSQSVCIFFALVREQSQYPARSIRIKMLIHWEVEKR